MGETGNLGLPELACRNALVKENLELAVGAASGLGQTEPGPDEADGAADRPEETALGAPVPRRRVQHQRGENVGRDASDVVQVTRKHNSLGPQTGRAEFGDEGVADGADGAVVHEGVDEEQAADGPLRGDVGLSGQRGEPNGCQDGAHDALAREVESASAKVLHQEPREDCAESAESVLGQGHGECVLLGHAGLLVEVCRISHECRAAKSLDGPCDTDNLGAAKIGALEAVDVACSALRCLLKLVGVDHHGDSLVGVEVLLLVAAGEADERLLGVVEALLADEPPGRLRGEEDADDEGDGPHPLKGKGNLVSPLVGTADDTSKNTAGNELTNNPAEVDVGSLNRELVISPKRDLVGILGLTR